mmetsp:Transcript_13658/g.21111  ORF Transcript_13658/g.21111 Transcript_13658/m.21111 type:complete len:274 (+) Transcript_13658:267-1088(+)
MNIAIFIKFLIVTLVTHQASSAKTQNVIDDQKENTSCRSSTFSAIRADNKTGLRPIELSKKLRMEHQSSQRIKNLPQTNLTKVLYQQVKPVTTPKRFQILHETMHDVSRLLIISTAVALVVVATTSSIPMLASSSTAVSMPKAAVTLLPAFVAPKHLSMLCLDLTNLYQVMINPYVITYLQTTFVPAALKLFRKFIVMEAWRRSWLHLGKPILNYVFPRSTSNWVEFLPSSWIQEIASFIDTSLQRGMESTFKKSIRTVVENFCEKLFQKLSG